MQTFRNPSQYDNESLLGVTMKLRYASKPSLKEVRSHAVLAPKCSFFFFLAPRIIGSGRGPFISLVKSLTHLVSMVSADHPLFEARDSPSALWWAVTRRIWKSISQIEIIIMPVYHHKPPDEPRHFLGFRMPHWLPVWTQHDCRPPKELIDILVIQKTVWQYLEQLDGEKRATVMSCCILCNRLWIVTVVFQLIRLTMRKMYCSAHCLVAYCFVFCFFLQNCGKNTMEAHFCQWLKNKNKVNTTFYFTFDASSHLTSQNCGT